MATGRLLVSTVSAEPPLNEGIDGVLDHIARRAGATVVATSPTVRQPGTPHIPTYPDTVSRCTTRARRQRLRRTYSWASVGGHAFNKCPRGSSAPRGHAAWLECKEET